MTGTCVQEYEYEGRSVPGGYYEIVVYRHIPTQLSRQEVMKISEPTMRGAYDKLGQAGFVITEDF